MHVGPIVMLLLQPTTFCNIDCSYCYLPHRSSKSRMSREVLEFTLKRAFESDFITDELQILWHAGEPLAAGKDFYRQAFALTKQLNTKRICVAHTFMTNATLIDDEWCDLLKDATGGVGLGVSLDGPEDIHDGQRRRRSGAGTHAETMRGVEILRSHGFKTPIIAVLTKTSLNNGERILDFFEENDLRVVQFNLEELLQDNSPHWSFSSKREAYDLYTKFLSEAYRRHKAGRLSILDFDDVSRKLNTFPSAPPRAVPLQWITVDVNGDFSTFCPPLHGVPLPSGERYSFGNVKYDEFVDIFSNPQFLKVNAAIMQGTEKCASSCSRFAICGSQQQTAKLFENGSFDSTETLYCRTRIMAPADLIESDPDFSSRRPRAEVGAG